MEKLNNDYEVECYIEDITCPVCKEEKFFIKFYCDKVIQLCGKCGYWIEI